MLDRLKTSLTTGPLFGCWALLYTIMEAITLFIVEMIYPISEIDILPSFNSSTIIETEAGEQVSYCESPLAFGDHLFSVADLQTNRHDFTKCKNKMNLNHNKDINSSVPSII